MSEQMTKSNQDIFYNSTAENSGAGEPLVNLENTYASSSIMGTDITSDFVKVDESLQGLLTDSGSYTEATTEETNVGDTITGINEAEPLIFSDTETGVLDNSDPTYQGSYSDVYRLDGLGNNEGAIRLARKPVLNTGVQLVWNLENQITVGLLAKGATLGIKGAILRVTT